MGTPAAGRATLDFDVLDVFTSTAFSGNPLAVVHGSRGLSDRQLQALAAEFALSETAFPLPADPGQRARGVDYALRIFTPRTELAFAGHPSVGTAWLLARRGEVRPGTVVQACGAGDLPLEVSAPPGPVTLTGAAPRVGDGLDAAVVAEAVGLRTADLLDPPPAVAGTPSPFLHVRVRPDALAEAGPDLRALRGLGSVYLFAWDDAGVRARMFGPEIGIAEDPATGSAALGLAVHAVATGLLPPDGPSAFTVRQGVEMGRPSTLSVSVEAAGGRATRTRVGGDVVPVSSGRIAVPPT